MLNIFNKVLFKKRRNSVIFKFILKQPNTIKFHLSFIFTDQFCKIQNGWGKIFENLKILILLSSSVIFSSGGVATVVIF